MTNFKSHKSIEKIAKKHGVDVSDIKNQLKIGISVEHEHTKNNDLAKDIALQHLDEFPDYYTKLKKMEKKSKNIKESHDEQRYCPLCQKRESRSECSYGEKVWDKISVKDEEYSMARSELNTIEDAVKKLKNTVGKGEGNLEAWVQSKITKAADYIDTASDYLTSGESTFEEKVLEAVIGRYEDRSKKLRPASERISSTKPKSEQKPTGPKVTVLKPRGPRKGEATASQVQGWRGSDRTNTNRRGQNAPQAKMISKEEKLVDKILKDIHEEDPCWKGYTQVGMKKRGGKKVPNCVPSKKDRNESVTIQDANGNDFIEFIDLIKPGPIKEATRLQAETGNIISVTLSWRGKYYAITMFFPQTKLPSRKDIQQEIQKIYPDSKVIGHHVSEFKPGQPLIRVGGYQGGNLGKLGSNKNYVKPMGEEVEIDEAKKSEMPCNKPKAQAVGDSKTGKSHVVKACEGGKEKLIRFGQRGVKGSPKKKGESEAYASRRHRFQTRHAKNIAKGKMSAAYWANKVKW